MKLTGKILVILCSSLMILAIVLAYLTSSYMQDNTDFFLENYSKDFVNSRENEIKNEIVIVQQMVKEIYTEGKANDYNDDNDEQIAQDIINFLRPMRFFDDKSGYVFVYDYNGKAVLVPTNPSIEGKDQLNVKDSKGVQFIKQLVQKAKKGGGFVRYTFRKKSGGKDLPKIAYAQKFEPYKWIIGTGVYTDSIDKSVANMSKEVSEKQTSNMSKLFIITIIIVALLMLISSLFTKKKIISYIQSTVKGLESLSDDLKQGKGDLTHQFPEKGKDEITQTVKAVNIFQGAMRKIIQNTKKQSTENSSIANELSATSLKAGKRAEESSSIISSTTQRAKSMQEEIKSSVDVAKQSRENLQKANVSIDEVGNSILNLTKQIEDSSQRESELAEKMQTLTSDAEQVKSVLTVISDIAEQTNLLALNAAIEAARAGEHGRGFAVVADEVRKLAERTQKSLGEINATINVIVQSISNASSEIEQNSKQAVDLTQVSSDLKDKMDNMNTVMSETIELSSQSVDSYIKTSEDLDQISQSVIDVDKLSKQNAKSVEEIAVASENLNKMTEQLRVKLDRFNT